MRFLVSVFICLIGSMAFSQSAENIIWKNFEVHVEGDQMGLFHTKNQSYAIPLGNHFIHISKFSNALVTVKDARINLYSCSADSIRMVFEGGNKLFVEFDASPKETEEYDFAQQCFIVENTFYGVGHGEKLTLVKSTWRSSSEFCIEVLESEIVLQDRKLKGRPGTSPLYHDDPNAPNYGENIIVTDSVTGQQSFIYDPPSPAEYASGVYSKELHKWIVSPDYYGITRTYVGWAVETIQAIIDENFYNSGEAIHYEILDVIGDPLEIQFSEADLLNDYQLFRHLVPTFKCDSILAIERSAYYIFSKQYMPDITFFTEGKTGKFNHHYREIVLEPFEFYTYLPFAECDFGIRKNELFVISEHTNYTRELDPTSEIAFGVTYMDNWYKVSVCALRVQSNSQTDSVFSFIVGPEVHQQEPEEIIHEKASFDSRDSFDAFMYVERIPNSSLLMINCHQSELLGTIPLINEDPNSPDFGENLIEIDKKTGGQRFVYDVELEREDKSGVFDLDRLNWIVPPKYYSIESTAEGFVTHATDDTTETNVITTYSSDGTIISEKEVSPDK